MKALTHWAQYMHTTFYLFATGLNVYLFFLDDYQSSSVQLQNISDGAGKSIKHGNGRLVRFRDNIFVSLCFPFGVMVCILYWGVVVLHPNGILTPENTRVMPVAGLYNQYLHTFPLLSDIAAVYLILHHYPRRFIGISVVTFASLSYVVWLVYVGNRTGYWSYLFVRDQTPFQFTIFVICCMTAASAVYIFGEQLSSFFWKKPSSKRLLRSC
eukprot:gene9321-10304_t